MKRTILSLLLAFALLFALTSCEKPGEGEKAEAGYQASQPLIDALTVYHQDHAIYPASLEDLVPAYLAELPQSVDEWPLEYEQSAEAGYTLTFRYTGPGMNVCTYTPSAGWDCYGYY